MAPPTNRAKAALRAQVNIMFDILTNCLNLTRKEAGKRLARELGLGGVKEDGAGISEDTILYWHDTIGGKSLSGSDSIYHRLRDDLDEKGWPSDKQAHLFLKARVKALRAAGHVWPLRGSRTSRD